MTNLEPIAADLGLPERAEGEALWMNALWLVLPRALPIRLHRQAPGKHVMKRGGALRGAPVGAADLCGWAVGRGLHLEIEAKFGTGKLRPQQRRWLEAASADGCVALVLTYDTRFRLLANLYTAVDATHAALVARGVAV